MGKKRIVKTEGADEKQKTAGSAAAAGSSGTGGTAPAAKSSKRKVDEAILIVQSTYNNTKMILTDRKGNSLVWSSSGSLGFKGAKKGTPFAAAKVGETLYAKAAPLGVKEIEVIVKGVGSGRESAIRGFISRGGINITSIKDQTPVPHNGVRPKKPRRV